MLSDSDVESYKQEGFLSGVQVMTESEVQYFRDSFDELKSKVGREKVLIERLSSSRSSL